MLSNLLARRHWRMAPISKQATLVEFIDQNSAYVTQTTLYGYLKTRSGFNYFRLFDDETFVASINIAKWNIYAICAGDLAAFCGTHLWQQLAPAEAVLGGYISDCLRRVFAKHDVPAEAGDEYPALRDSAIERICQLNWRTGGADESSFHQSPDALVYWAPVVEQYKKYDAHIVRNSMIFKWKEVRQNFRRRVDLPALRRELENTNAEAIKPLA